MWTFCNNKSLFNILPTFCYHLLALHTYSTFTWFGGWGGKRIYNNTNLQTHLFIKIGMHLTTFSNLSYKEYYVYEYNKWLLHINLEQIVYNNFGQQFMLAIWILTIKLYITVYSLQTNSIYCTLHIFQNTKLQHTINDGWYSIETKQNMKKI